MLELSAWHHNSPPHINYIILWNGSPIRKSLNAPRIMTSLCNICKNIPYSKLPSEDELAYPHQPSLQALAISAQSCKFCKFIQDAVNELKKTFEDEKKGETVGRFILFKSTDTETRITTEKYFGPALPWNLPTGQWAKITVSSSSSVEERYDVIRPWIFGNWWVLDKAGAGSQPANQLIGIGVRIGKNPNITDAQ